SPSWRVGAAGTTGAAAAPGGAAVATGPRSSPRAARAEVRGWTVRMAGSFAASRGTHAGAPLPRKSPWAAARFSRLLDGTCRATGRAGGGAEDQREDALRKRATANGTKTASSTSEPTTTVGTGCCIGKVSATGTEPVLPNSSRAACTSAETGFQLAKTSSGRGRLEACTKALEMKVSGKRTMKDALLMTSGVRTRMPRKAMTQLKA